MFRVLLKLGFIAGVFATVGSCALAQAALGGSSEKVLPAGVKAVWDLEKAYRQSTPTRERVCINGLWRWQPAPQLSETVPEDGWGYFKVPGCWPGITDYMQKDCQVVYRHPSWADVDIRSVSAAWYQREITIPPEWAGRRILLSARYVNTAAAVYIDGNRVGELRWPAGEVDLTSACSPGRTHVLSMYFVALPPSEVVLAFSDTSRPKQVRGSVRRRGLCGDVYLVGEPPAERIDGVKVDTSVRRWEITFTAALEDLVPGKRYTVRADVKEDGRLVRRFTSEPFSVEDLKEGRVAFTRSWKPDRLWDIHTPQNQYDLDVSLLSADGALVDRAFPERFGFREFWIEGRDFYLNGTRIFLSAVPVDNAQVGAAWASYEGARESLLRLKSFGINFVYTHNYGCQPGSHLSFDEVLRAADDVGMLVAISQPHFRHYDWDAPDAEKTNGYEQDARFYVGVAGNHPAVVAYSTSHNATGYSEDMAPHMIDGIHDPRTGGAVRNAQNALRAQAILNRLDPSRITYHHAGGNTGPIHTSNFYPNFVPIQEMSDWFEHWATVGVKPAFTCEYAAPGAWDWSMYHGWYKGLREFGSAVVPWEFALAEWNAQFFGDEAFKISDEEAENLRWEAAQFRQGRLWHRWDYPHRLSSRDFDERYPVFAMYITDNWRAFRTWGLSANSPWEHGHFWRLREGTDTSRKDLPVDWEHLQRPGFSPDYLDDRYERMDLAYEKSDWEATEAAQALLRNNMPLLAYIAGKPEHFTEKGHNFLPGETVEKQIIIINNARQAVACDYRWSFALPEPVTGSGGISLPTGEQSRIPIRVKLPESLTPGRYELTMSVKFSTGETQEDSFTVDVMPGPAPPRVAAAMAVFDPKGETAALLKGFGLRFEAVGADADLSPYDILVIGKGALTPDGPAPDISGVRDGLKVVIFEQTGEVLEKRFGFRVAEYGLRNVFRRVPDHPLLSGLTEQVLHDWRGEATILPPSFEYELDYAPTVEWCGIRIKRLWRCGCRGNVASALIEKPACGDFLPIVDGGFSLQYTPLLEYREGKGMVIFCQMDVTGRTETDPAARTLAANIMRYVARWEPAPRRNAVYVGDPLGRKHLEATGLELAPYSGGKPAADQVLIVGRGGGRQLADSAADIAEWLEAGGHILALGLSGEEASAFLPFEVTTESREHIAAYFPPPAADSPLAGVGPADVHNRAPRDLPHVAGGAVPVGDGILATARGLNVVFCQITPQEINPTLGLPTAFSVTRDGTGAPVGLVTLGPVTPAGARLGQRVEGLEPGTYTLTVLAGAAEGSVTAHLRADLSPRRRARFFQGTPVARGEDVRLSADKLTELHLTFSTDESAARGLFVYLESAQPGARIRVKSFTLCKGGHVPSEERQASGSAENLLQNGDFAQGERGWRFEFTQQRNLKRTYRRVSCLVTRLLANMGVAGRVPILEHVSRPVQEGEARWLDGLYVDVPEGWDYPYRFFRW